MIVDFPHHKVKKSKHVLRPKEVNFVRFFTGDKRTIWMEDQKDIQKIMDFLNKEKIKLFVS